MPFGVQVIPISLHVAPLFSISWISDTPARYSSGGVIQSDTFQNWEQLQFSQSMRSHGIIHRPCRIHFQQFKTSAMSSLMGILSLWIGEHLFLKSRLCILVDCSIECVYVQVGNSSWMCYLSLMSREFLVVVRAGVNGFTSSDQLSICDMCMLRLWSFAF